MVLRILTTGLLLILAMAGACGPNGSEDERPVKGRAHLSGYDLLCYPGEPVRIEAKLEADDPLGVRPDMAGRPVVFTRKGTELGSARTDGDGMAGVHTTFSEPGHVRIQARLPGTSPLRAEPADILVAVVPPARTLLVSDVDHTLADVSAVAYLFTENEAVPPLPGSLKAVRTLAESHELVYLTARDDRFMKSTKDWLSLKGFPRAPVLTWDLGESTIDHGTFKKTVLMKLAMKWRVALGVGDKAHDATAYLAVGARAYIITDEPDDDWPPGTVPVPTWHDVLTREQQEQR